jgi:hypothetical protein
MDTADLTKGLQSFLAQFNAAFPLRDHTSDGTIGDAAHKAETSGHNLDDTPGSKAAWNDRDGHPEVRAIDIDSDLRTPGVTMQAVLDHLRKLPNISKHVRYFIYNRKMYHYSTGYQPETYTGPSPHTEHLHVEGAWIESADNDTTYDYRLRDLLPKEDEVTPADRTAIAQEVVELLTAKTPLKGADGKTDGTFSTPLGAFGLSQGIPDGTDPKGARTPAWAAIQNLGKAVVALGAKVDALAKK